MISEYNSDLSITSDKINPNETIKGHNLIFLANYLSLLQSYKFEILGNKNGIDIKDYFIKNESNEKDIYVDSYMDDNLLDPNYISYTQELKNINQNQLENKKYKSIFDNISESDTFSDDDDSIQSEEFIKNQVHNQKDSNSETMED
jgi:hypothetical protein